MILKKKTYFFRIILGIILALVISIITYQQKYEIFLADINYKIQTFDLGFSRPQPFLNYVNHLPGIIKYKLGLNEQSQNIEELHIDIKLEEYKKILRDRQKSLLANGLSNPVDVKAKIQYKNKYIKAKIRLKGDLNDHWISRYQMSFRVSLKGKNYIQGFKKFSLHKPESRQHPLDQTYSYLSQLNGNLSAPHNYIRVFVNGESWGIMNIEEHMSKELLEKQQYKDSLIIRFCSEKKGVLYSSNTDNYGLYRLSDQNLYLKVYNEDDYIKEPINRKWLSYISQERLKKKHSHLYNPHKYTKALFQSMVWNDAHPLLCSNSRHYFNPYLLQLEPIPSDAYIPFKITKVGLFPRRKFDPFINITSYKQLYEAGALKENIEANLSTMQKIISNSDNIIAYYQNFFPLDNKVKISSILFPNFNFIKQNKTKLFENNGEKYTSNTKKPILYITHIENGRLEVFNLIPENVQIIALINNNQRFTVGPFNIAAYTNELRTPFIINTDLKKSYDKNLKVVIKIKGKEQIITVRPSLAINSHYVPPPVFSINELPKPTINQAKIFPDHILARHFSNGKIEIYNLLPDEVLINEVTDKGKPINIKENKIAAYQLNDYTATILNTNLTGIFDNNIVITTSYKGVKRKHQIGATQIKEGLYNPLLTKTTSTRFLIRIAENEWKIINGEWIISKPIVIQGNLSIDKNVKLQFGNNAYLIVKGAIHAIGTKKSPIIFGAINNSWKGLYIVNAKKQSVLENVVIRNTKALSDGLLNLSGGVTFYQSDVIIKNVQFTNTQAEDALNLVKTNFTIEDLKVNKTMSDAIDFDFSQGTILNTEFKNIGGDALDFSGTKAKINNFTAENVKDKGISVGEKSTIEITNSKMENMGVGIVSKDASIVIGNNLSFVNIKLKVAMTYIKKGFYGLPEMHLKNISTDHTKQAYISQKGTLLTIDSKAVKTEELDVAKLYQSEIMAK